MGVDAPETTMEETEVMTDAMSTQIAAVYLNEFIVIRIGKVRES